MSTQTIRSAIEIDAPPAAVWSVLTDTGSYPDWNPFVRRLEGSLDLGATLDVRIAPPGARSMRFKPTVLAAVPGQELRWLGRFLAPGIFDGEHSFTLEPLGEDRTRLVQEERFSGLLVRPFRSTLEKTLLGFEQMNEALKTRVEADAAAA